jgi:hypothetical protein
VRLSVCRISEFLFVHFSEVAAALITNLVNDEKASVVQAADQWDDYVFDVQCSCGRERPPRDDLVGNLRDDQVIDRTLPGLAVDDCSSRAAATAPCDCFRG